MRPSNLVDLRELSPETWQSVSRRVAAAASLLLAVALGYEVVAIARSVARDPQIAASLPERAGTPTAEAPSAPTDLSALAVAHLFGEARDAPPPVLEAVADAPDTELQLTLTGTVLAESTAGSYAIIEVEGRDQRLYRIGAELEVGDGTTLHSVHADRVLLQRGERLEALRFVEFAGVVPGARLALVTVAQPERAESLQQVGPSPFREIVRLTADVELPPALEGEAASDVVVSSEGLPQGSRVVGLRVAPGRSSDAFGTLGLRGGDLITGINGTPLDDPARAAELVASLGESGQAVVEVVRDGTPPQTVVIDTSTLQALARR